MIERYLTIYRCPRCSGPLRLGRVDETDAREIRRGELLCSTGCGAFPIERGIVYLLPDDSQISEVKRREREGWVRIAREHNALETRDRVLMELPYVSADELGDAGEAAEHWRQATMTFPVVMAMMRQMFSEGANGADGLRGARVLEVGASIGWGARRLADAGADVVATDFNADPDCGLGKAEFFFGHGVPVFERLCADAEFLPLAESSFDFVFCCATIHHFERPAALLAAVARALKPGGAFFAINEAFRPALIRSAREQIKRSRPTLDHLEFGINEQVFTHGEYRRFFQEAGLRFRAAHPRWDAAAMDPDNPLGSLRVGRGLGLRREKFELSDAGRSPLRRAANALGLARALRLPPVEAAARAALFNFTNSYRILIGEKPNAGAAT